MIGFGIKSFDRFNAAMNKNGLYKLELFVNKEKVYQHKVETFSFAEGKYINLLVDYDHYYNKRERIQQCFIVQNNELSIYDNIVNNGNIFIQNGLSYTIDIVASDINGNKTTLTIPVQGKEQEIVFEKPANITPYYFKREVFNKANSGIVSIAIPKKSFYQDIYFDFSYDNGIAKVHNGSVPLHKPFTLSFDVSEYPIVEQKKLFIGKVNSKGYVSYNNTKRKENKLYINTKSLGNYKLASDTEKPTITPVNFKNGQWISNYKYLKVKLKDNLSGIKNYRATINGEWILMEYEPKTRILTYDFKDYKYKSLSTTSKHLLKIVVSDKLNNTKTYIATFYRK